MKTFVRGLLAAAFLFGLAPLGAQEWRPLFNGTLEGWRTWLAGPHESMTVESLARDPATGRYEKYGWDRDPLGVFTVAVVDGQPAIHVSGQVFGVLMTRESFGDFHLRLQFKWGEKRWAPRTEVVRDSGLLYRIHGEPGLVGGAWPPSVELQIQEHDCGDLWTVGSRIEVPARRATAADGKPVRIYDPAGTPATFGMEPAGGRCIKGADFEKPTGEWNTIELVCLGDESIHIVNGHVVMRLKKARGHGAGDWAAPLVSGPVLLQSEGAEVFYRDVQVRAISAVPVEFAEK